MNVWNVSEHEGSVRAGAGVATKSMSSREARKRAYLLGVECDAAAAGGGAAVDPGRAGLPGDRMPAEEAYQYAADLFACACAIDLVAGTRVTVTEAAPSSVVTKSDGPPVPAGQRQRVDPAHAPVEKGGNPRPFQAPAPAPAPPPAADTIPPPSPQDEVTRTHEASGSVPHEAGVAPSRTDALE